MKEMAKQNMIINGINKDLISQMHILCSVLQQNPVIQQVFDRAHRLQFPNWYLGAGCIAQTVWNYLSEQELTTHINDLDLVYFDANDRSYESEHRHIEHITDLFKDFPLPLDIKNQARVHLWYEEHFGYSIPPYHSLEDAINSWPTTATCIGVKYIRREFRVYAPYGLNDLFGMIVRPNKVQITEEIYMKKVKRWKQCWPKLHIVPW